MSPHKIGNELTGDKRRYTKTPNDEGARQVAQGPHQARALLGVIAQV